MTGKRWKVAASAVLTLAIPGLLAGCVSFGGGKTPPTLFTLTAERAVAPGTALSGQIDDAITVLEPEADRRLAVARVAVQVDDSNVAYLKDAQWVERPAHIFALLLAETIRAGGTHLVFTGDEPHATSKTRLGGRLVDFGYDARILAAVVRYEAVRTGPGGRVSTRRFEAEVPVVKAEPEVIGPALNKAANDVAAQVADWIG